MGVMNGCLMNEAMLLRSATQLRFIEVTCADPQIIWRLLIKF